MLVEMSARMRQKIDTLDRRMIWIHNLNWEHSLSQYSFQVWFPATLVTRSLEEKFDTYKSLRELRRIDQFRLMKGILCLSVRLSNFLSRKSSQAKRFVISLYELSFVEKQWHVLHRNGRCLKKDYEQTSCSLWLKVNCRQKARCMKHLKEKKNENENQFAMPIYIKGFMELCYVIFFQNKISENLMRIDFS